MYQSLKTYFIETLKGGGDDLSLQGSDYSRGDFLKYLFFLVRI